MVELIVAAVIGLVLGLGLGYALWQNALKKKVALMIAEAKKEAEQKGGHRRPARPERQIAEQIEELILIGKWDQKIVQHS